MSDLTFIDVGNPNFLQDNLINFSKCRLIYNQIKNLILRQVINNNSNNNNNNIYYFFS